MDESHCGGRMVYNVADCNYRLKAEEERSRLEGMIEEVRKERDVIQQECEELKVQLHLAEDRLDVNHNQLQEITHKLKEGLWVN
jgi:septal ring factor EnvC (AmiA/AmiB activator)